MTGINGEAYNGEDIIFFLKIDTMYGIILIKVKESQITEALVRGNGHGKTQRFN